MIILHKSLYQHQRKAVIKCLKKQKFGLFYDMGTGKTRIMIYVIKNLNKIKGIKALVVSPISIIEDAWLKEACNAGIQIHNLRKGFNKSDNYIINYESFMKFTNIKELDTSINCVILDESIKIKTPNAKITKLLYKFVSRHNFKYRYILSGNPTPNSLLELFSQIRFLSNNIFGTIYQRFKDEFFYKMGFKYFVSAKKKEVIYNKISDISEFIRKEECVDLPDKIDVIRRIELPKTTKEKYYDEMAKQMVIEIEDEYKVKQTISVHNIAIKLMKLRQILSGFIYDSNKTPIRIDNAKLKELKYLLEQLKSEQVIIWCTFREDINHLYNELKDKERVTYIYGGLSDSVRQERIKGFQDNKYRILLANPQSIGHGLTFVNSRYAVYYSLDFNLDTHQQSRDRIHRIGQTKKVTYFYLLCDKTVDFYIYKSLRRKKFVLEDMIKFLKGDTDERK